MASKKADSPHETTPPSAERSRSSGAAPRSHEITARRGRVRDALAALGNLETVLRSRAHVLGAEELDELRRGLTWVRESFTAATLEGEGDQRAARAELEAFAATHVAAIEAALVETPRTSNADVISRATRELEAAAGLLELAERSTEGAQVDVSVATLAEQALHLAWTVRSYGALGVHVKPCEGDCSVSCDPHVVARVLAIAVAIVRESAGAVVVRTHVEEDAGVIEVTRYSSDDLSARVMQTRVAPHTGPTDAVVAAAARSAGIQLVIEPARVLVRCPRVA